MMSWKQRAIRALKRSIEHWERMRDNPMSAPPTTSHCGCCHEFLIEGMPRGLGERRCDTCPVHLISGQHLCGNTPYRKAASFLWLARGRSGRAGLLAGDGRDAVQREIEFLRDVLGCVRQNQIHPEGKCKR